MVNNAQSSSNAFKIAECIFKLKQQQIEDAR